MAFLSKLHGRQVNKAVQMSAHRGYGSLLSFDSKKDFPSIRTLANDLVESGRLFAYDESGNRIGQGTPNSDDYIIKEMFDYLDSSTKNVYIDTESNMMYRWKHYTKLEWAKENWEWTEEVVDDHGNVITPSTYIEPTKAMAPKVEDYNNAEEFNEAYQEWIDHLYPAYFVESIASVHTMETLEDDADHPAMLSEDRRYKVGGDHVEPQNTYVPKKPSANGTVTDEAGYIYGYAYVPCAGGGGGELVWNSL